MHNSEGKCWKRTGETCCTVQTRIYLQEIEKMLHENHSASIPVSGISMYPFLTPNCDYVGLRPMDTVRCRPGMIVLFRRESGAYVLHRIIKCKNESVFLAGDGQCILEGPIHISQVVGWVSHVYRRGKWVALWRRKGFMFGVLWRWAFPVRRYWFGGARRLSVLVAGRKG